MSKSNSNEEDQNTNNSNNSKTNKEKSFNLVQTIMSNSDLININNNSSQSFTNQFQNQQQNINFKNATSSTLSANTSNYQSNSKNNSSSNNNIQIMKEMKAKISSNDTNSIIELLENSSTLTKQGKNQLLNYAFQKYNTTNNINQKDIIKELIRYGADANYKLNFFESSNDKTKTNNPQGLSKSNIKITPLIYCCIRGDYELFKKIIEVNSSVLSIEETNNHNNNFKNYMFYFFENGSNMDNKYNIANDIFMIKKNKYNNINININEYDNQSGMTLLMLSVIKQYINFINLFLEKGADINKKNLKDGNTALHYAAKVKNKDIIELLLKNNNCDLLIKNNNNETIIDVVSKNNSSTEIYTLLASKYGEQQKLLEEKTAQEKTIKSKNINYEKNNNKNKNNNNNNYYYYNSGNNNINNNVYNGYMNNNNSNVNDSNNNGEKNGSADVEYDEGIDIINQNKVNSNIEDLNSYLEIPFQFVNHMNYINYFESNNNVNNNNFALNNNNIGNNNSNNIRNYLHFKNTPILNINLKSEEDEDLLILDNLKNENDKYELEFAEIESKLENVYNEQNSLLMDLSKLNLEIKNINNEINSYSKIIKENENKNMYEINNINLQKKVENDTLDILYTQEHFIKLKNCHENLLKDENYLNKKFSDDSFKDEQIKKNLAKDIIDFQLYNKEHVKKKLISASKIRSDLQLLLERNGFDYTVYIFGSYATNLCLPWSDLDLSLFNKSQNINSALKLQEIVNVLSNSSWVDNPKLISNYYSFPYVTFSTDEEHGFMKVNLAIQDKSFKGNNCVKTTKEFLMTYKNAEPLTLIVKQLLKCSNTLFSLSNFNNNNQSETLNSYSIILMIIYFLQIHLMGKNIEMINNPEYLGELFFNFLIFYSNFDLKEKRYIFVRCGLKDSIENDDYYHLNSSENKLIVVDPLDHKNNVALKTVEFSNIQFILRLIFYSSRVKCDCSCHYLNNYDYKEKDEEDKKNNDDKNDIVFVCDNNNDKDIRRKFVELGTEHCILKKIFKTAYRINSNLLKEFN